MLPTIYEIKNKVDTKAFAFFDDEVLKELGQTIEDFQVFKLSNDKIGIIAISYGKYPDAGLGEDKLLMKGLPHFVMRIYDQEIQDLIYCKPVERKELIQNYRRRLA